MCSYEQMVRVLQRLGGHAYGDYSKERVGGIEGGLGGEKSISFIFRLPSRGGVTGMNGILSHTVSHSLIIWLWRSSVRTSEQPITGSIHLSVRHVVIFFFFFVRQSPPPLSSLSLFDECVCAPTDNLLYMHIDVVSGSMAVFVSTPLSHHPTQSPL